jgi:putative redox protein
MKLDVADFKIDIEANLTEEHPKYYDKVAMHFHFYGDNLSEKKLQKAVDLSIEKYCGVMEMFRQFAEVTTQTHFHKK